MRADLLQFMRGSAHLGVGPVWLQIVRQHTFPIRFLVGGDRGPVPVLHHVGAVGEMGVDVFAHLAVVRRKLEGRVPANGLGVGFGYEIIPMLQRTREVALDRLGRPVEVVLGSVVDVVGGNVEERGDGLFVDVVAHHAAVVGGDELPWPFALAHQVGLPMEEVRDAHLAPARPLQLVAGALCAVACGQVFPGVNVLAPVIEEPGLAQSFGRAKLLFKVVLEADEDIAIGGVVAGGFVVKLPADDGGVVFVVGDDVANEPLGIEAIRR